MKLKRNYFITELSECLNETTHLSQLSTDFSDNNLEYEVRQLKCLQLHIILLCILPHIILLCIILILLLVINLCNYNLFLSDYSFVFILLLVCALAKLIRTH
jgi:hypothetical protein